MSRSLLLLLLLPLLAFTAKAQQDGYIETGQWQVSVGLGLGAKSNPVVGGKNIPLMVVPDIAYYDESFYFDNGDLGYTFVDAANWSLSVLGRFNAERAYFSFLHPNNILLGSGTSVDSSIPGNTFPDNEVTLPTLDDLAKRKFAFDVGLQLNVYLSEQAVIRMGLLADVSGVYDGTNGWVEYNLSRQLGQWQLGFGAGLRFKSRGLVDYYYGIDERDEVDEQHYYQGRQTINPFIKVNGAYPLTAKWRVLLLAKWAKLGSGMTDSPVVSGNSVSTLFAGVSYEF